MQQQIKADVVPPHDLLVTVEEQLATSVFPHDNILTVCGIYQMPVPVVEVEADVFTPICQTVFRFQVGGGVVPRDFDRGLQIKQASPWKSFPSTLKFEEASVTFEEQS